MSKKHLMHGPKFDGSGDIEERQIDEADIGAYTAAGYVMGKFEPISVDEAVEVAMLDRQTDTALVEPKAEAPKAKKAKKAKK